MQMGYWMANRTTANQLGYVPSQEGDLLQHIDAGWSGLGNFSCDTRVSIDQVSIPDGANWSIEFEVGFDFTTNTSQSWIGEDLTNNNRMRVTTDSGGQIQIFTDDQSAETFRFSTIGVENLTPINKKKIVVTGDSAELFIDGISYGVVTASRPDTSFIINSIGRAYSTDLINYCGLARSVKLELEGIPQFNFTFENKKVNDSVTGNSYTPVDPTGNFDNFSYAPDKSGENISTVVDIVDSDRAVSNWGTGMESTGTNYPQSLFDVDNICIKTRAAINVTTPTGTLLPYRLWTIRDEILSTSLALGMTETGTLGVFRNTSSVIDSLVFINDGVVRDYDLQTDATGNFGMYIDGELVKTGTWDKAILPSVPFMIGSQTGNNERQWLGQIVSCEVCSEVVFDFIDGTGLEQKSTDGNYSTFFTGNEGVIWDKGITTSFVSNGNYALRNNVPVVTAVAEADRPVFTNDGTDYIDLGRPTWLNKLRPSVDEFTVCATGRFINNGYNTIVSWGCDSADGSFQEFNLLKLGGTESLAVLVGGTINSNTAIPIVLGDVYDIVVSVSLTDVSVWANKSPVISNGNVGSFIGSTNSFIGGRTDGISDNMDGQTWDVEFYEGYTADGDCSSLTPIEKFPLDEGNGATEVVGTVEGTIGVITDGSPLDVWVNGITYLTNLNPTNDNDLDLIGITDNFLTRADFDSLYAALKVSYGKTIFFVTPIVADSTLLPSDRYRSLIYTDTTTLTTNEETSADEYTGRGFFLINALDFSNPSNSQYLTILTGAI